MTRGDGAGAVVCLIHRRCCKLHAMTMCLVPGDVSSQFWQRSSVAQARWVVGDGGARSGVARVDVPGATGCHC